MSLIQKYLVFMEYITFVTELRLTGTGLSEDTLAPFTNLVFALGVRRDRTSSGSLDGM